MLKAVTLSPVYKSIPLPPPPPPPPPARPVAASARGPPTLTRFQRKQTSGSFSPPAIKTRRRPFLDCHRLNTNTGEVQQRLGPCGRRGRRGGDVLIRRADDATKLETLLLNIRSMGCIVFPFLDSTYDDTFLFLLFKHLVMNV